MTLRLCRWPMKCHVELRDAAAALASSSCARFSPTTRDPGLGERAELLDRDVLDRGEDLGSSVAADLVAHLARGWRRRARVEAADQLRHATPAWRPVTPPSRRWEKKRSASQIVHRPKSSISVHAGRLRRARGDRLEVERALAGRRTPRGPRRRPRSSTARRPARSRRPAARRRRAAQRATPSSSTPPASPRQPRVEHRRRRPAPASATGRQSATRTIAATPGARRDLAVGLLDRSGSSTTTRVPWTWRPCASRAAPACARTRSRLAATRSGSSSVSRPRLSDAYGPSETPPRRVGEERPWRPGRSMTRCSPTARKLTSRAARGRSPARAGRTRSARGRRPTSVSRSVQPKRPRAAVQDGEAHRGHLAVVAVGLVAVGVVVGDADERARAARRPRRRSAACRRAPRSASDVRPKRLACADTRSGLGREEVLAAEAPDDRRARPDLAARSAARRPRRRRRTCPGAARRRRRAKSLQCAHAQRAACLEPHRCAWPPRAPSSVELAAAEQRTVPETARSACGSTRTVLAIPARRSSGWTCS